MIANMCSSAVTPGQMCEKPKKKKKVKTFFKTVVNAKQT